MDYEKKYNEALELARNYHNGLAPCRAKDELETIFPQLRESEDERIRKYLIEELKAAKSVGELKFIIPQPTREECIAYLEKQKGQKHPNGCFTCDEYKKGYEAGRFHGFTAGYNKAMKEQKPISQEDFDAAKHEALWGEQKPAEWSEEDEDMLNSCISSIEESKENRYAYKETDGDTSYDREVDWLKSLRPQPHWKPSEEQMYSLGTVVKGAGDNSVGSIAYNLKELYEQLKKLI